MSHKSWSFAEWLDGSMNLKMCSILMEIVERNKPYICVFLLLFVCVQEGGGNGLKNCLCSHHIYIGSWGKMHLLLFNDTEGSFKPATIKNKTRTHRTSMRYRSHHEIRVSGKIDGTVIAPIKSTKKNILRESSFHPLHDYNSATWTIQLFPFICHPSGWSASRAPGWCTRCMLFFLQHAQVDGSPSGQSRQPLCPRKTTQATHL